MCRTKIRTLNVFILNAVMSVAVGVAAYPVPTVFPDPTLNGIGIQKTMTKLVNGQAVKIVFFGQSIVATDINQWPDSLTKYLRNRFPTAAITMVNAAISGCSADCMLSNNNVATKLVPQNPDLIILYIYYHVEPEMEAMIRQIVSQMPNTEVLLFNDHFSPATTHWSPEGQASEIPWEDASSWDYIPAMCEKYGFGFLDIRTPWNSYLASFYKGHDSLTIDGIHLNPIGQNLMSLLPRPYFIVRRDTIPPVIDSIAGSGKKIWIRFSEKVDSITAKTSSNYSISGGTSVLGVMLNADKRTVVALTSASLTGGTYTVSVSNVKDRAGNTMAAAQKSVTLPPVPAGWSSCDIGRVFTPGNTTINSTTGDLTLRGGGEHASPMNCAWPSGNNIAWSSSNNPCDPYWLWRNEFQYAYKTLEGDFTLTAHISNTDSLNGKSQAGIIIREDLQYISKFVALNTVKKGYLDYVKRVGLLDSIIPVKPRSASAANLWLRLRRTGATIEAFTSADTSAWTNQGTTSLPMTSQVTAGVFVCGNEYSLGPYIAKFNNVTLASTTHVQQRDNTPEGKSPLQFTNLKNRVVITGLTGGIESEIEVFNLQGKTLSRHATKSPSYVVLLPRGGVYIISVRNGKNSMWRQAIFS
jgi:regulation of enolase protein 1 (concanavalin A-like superfamily)